MCWQLDQYLSLVRESLLLVSLVCFTAPLAVSVQAGATCSYCSFKSWFSCTPDIETRIASRTSGESVRVGLDRKTCGDGTGRAGARMLPCERISACRMFDDCGLVFIVPLLHVYSLRLSAALSITSPILPTALSGSTSPTRPGTLLSI